MKRIIFSIVLIGFLVPAYGFSSVWRNNEAVESIKDTLLYNADKKLKESLDKDPDNPILNYNYGLTKLKQYEEYKDDSGLEQAIQSFEKAKTDTTKSNLQANSFNQANAYYNLKDYANAINSYQESGTYLDTTNVDPDLLYNYANSLYKFVEENTEYDSLLTMAQDIYKSTSGMVDKDHRQKIWHNLGNTAFQQENFQEAISYYVEALKLDPKSEDTRINYEVALRKLAQQQSQNQQQQEQEQENQEGSEEQKQESSGKQEQEQQQQDAKEKQEQYDELSDEEKEKLEAEKKLDALLQEQSREEDNDKPEIRKQKPSGRYW